MTKGIQYQMRVHFRPGRHGHMRLETGEGPSVSAEPGRLPRISRLMALAIRFDGLVREGVVADQAELARLGHVSRARITQIMNLLHLAPDIQEALLFLARCAWQGPDPGAAVASDRRRVRLAEAAADVGNTESSLSRAEPVVQQAW